LNKKGQGRLTNNRESETRPASSTASNKGPSKKVKKTKIVYGQENGENADGEEEIVETIYLTLEWNYFPLLFKNLKRPDMNNLFSLMLNCGHAQRDPYMQDLKKIEFAV